MSRTIAWSPRVGEVWLAGDVQVEIVGDHPQARMVLLRGHDDDEWVPYSEARGLVRPGVLRRVRDAVDSDAETARRGSTESLVTACPKIGLRSTRT